MHEAERVNMTLNTYKKEMQKQCLSSCHHKGSFPKNIPPKHPNLTCRWTIVLAMLSL